MEQFTFYLLVSALSVRRVIEKGLQVYIISASRWKNLWSQDENFGE